MYIVLAIVTALVIKLLDKSLKIRERDVDASLNLV